jgi:hypothetical protein
VVRQEPVRPYDYRGCQSLFGYAAKVHERSGGVCELCGCGSERLDFDLWRQLTVEHLIGESQGGYLRQITASLAERLPTLAADELAVLARRIDEANTITACSFCNATTSRSQAPIGMTEAIAAAPAEPELLFLSVTSDLSGIRDTKREEVNWKLESVRAAYEERIAPALRRR